MAKGSRYEPERIKMLADAVFAIGMTILVLDLKVGDGFHSDGEITAELRHDIVQFGAYALSFYVLGLIWLGHVRLFRRIECVDDWMFKANLFLLFFVGLLPFPTALIGHYGSYTWGIVPYAACMMLLEASLALMWRHCDQAGLLVDEIDPTEVRRMTARYAGMIFVFLLSIPIAFVIPRYAAFTWFLLAVVPQVMERAARKGAPKTQAPPG